jgi:tetratricopeptide (TPR) repeat protein
VIDVDQEGGDQRREPEALERGSAGCPQKQERGEQMRGFVERAAGKQRVPGELATRIRADQPEDRNREPQRRQCQLRDYPGAPRPPRSWSAPCHQDELSQPDGAPESRRSAHRARLPAEAPNFLTVPSGKRGRVPMRALMRASKKSVAGARSRLLERDWELSTIRESLKAAARGVGAVVFVEAPAGGGKSALLRATREFARRTHGLVLAATGTELERDFAFGTALALLEPLWLAASPTEREAMIDGPARLAATVLQKNDATQRTKSRDRHYPTVHALFWLIRHITRSELCDGGSSSLVLLVDDGHWIDGPSLRFLAYLSERLADLPIAIVIAARPGELAADRSALSALRRAAGGTLLQPAPLSPEAVTDLVRASFPRAPGKFCAECARFTGGNPWLVIELLDKLREDEMVPSTPNSSTVRETMPERVQDAVSSRLAAMTKTERAVVKTASILGEQATVRQVARLAELEPEGVRMAADRLAAKCVLRPGVPISFVNPLVRSAVAASLAPLERAEAHVRAAHVLADEQAEPQEISSHLLQAPPEGDPAAIAPLRQAAEIAIESGDYARAIALLQRALVEHPSAAQKVDVLAELGSAEMSAGLRSGSERFSEARRLSRRPARRGRLALDQAHSLYEQQRFAEAAAVLDAALTDLQRKPEALSAELTSASVAVSSLVGPTSERVVERREQLLGSLPAAPTAMQRAAVAHIALCEGVSGTASKQVRALAELAWADGAPLPAPGSYSLSWPLLCGALVFADELERMIELVDAPRTVGSEQSAAARRMIGYARAWARYEQGQIADAEADVNAALKSKRGGRMISPESHWR